MLETTFHSTHTPSSPFSVSEQLSTEDALVHASELLHCAIATAYESGDSLEGSSRDLAFSVLHLVQMASAMVDRSLDRVSVR